LPNLPFSRVKPPFFKGVTPPFFKGVTPPLKRSHNITKLNPSQTTINKFQICSSSLTQNNHQFRSSTIVNSIGRQLLLQRWHARAKTGRSHRKIKKKLKVSHPWNNRQLWHHDKTHVVFCFTSTAHLIWKTRRSHCEKKHVNIPPRLISDSWSPCRNTAPKVEVRSANIVLNLEDDCPGPNKPRTDAVSVQNNHLLWPNAPVYSYFQFEIDNLKKKKERTEETRR
jgi:hypothetical protein